MRSKSGPGGTLYHYSLCELAQRQAVLLRQDKDPGRAIKSDRAKVVMTAGCIKRTILSHKPSMGCLNITLINHSILHRSINLRMSQYFLYLFNRHSLINSSGSHSSSKFMRMDSIQIQFASHLSQSYFHPANF